MKLIVIGPNFQEAVYGITLDEGLTPSLSTLSEEESKLFKIPDVEPAVWFKTLVISEITINCVTRQIFYSSNSQVNNNNDDEKGFTTSMISTCTLDIVAEDDGDTQPVVSPNLKRLLRRKRRNASHMKKMSESMRFHPDGAGQNVDLDEIFNSMIQVIEKYQKQKLTKLEYYQELFRLLHCYILPSVTFGKVDIPQLEAALEFQTALISRQDDKISAKFDEAQNVKGSLDRLRKQFGESINSVNSGAKLTYPQPLAIALFNDYQEDLQTSYKDLNEASDVVTLVKKQLAQAKNELENMSPCSENETASGSHNVKKHRTHSTKQKVTLLSLTETQPSLTVTPETTWNTIAKFEEKLQKERTNRNHIREEINWLLNVREKLSEYISDRILIRSDSKSKVTKRQIIRSKLKLKGKHKIEQPLHKIYLSLTENRSEKFKEMETLIGDKVKLVSVKEGVKSALDELRTENVAYGVDFDSFGSLRSTDVMSRPGLPVSWQTLEELVKQTIDDESNPIAQLHVEACRKVLSECEVLRNFQDRCLESESGDFSNDSPDSNSLVGPQVDDYAARNSFSSSLDSFLNMDQKKNRRKFVRSKSFTAECTSPVPPANETDSLNETTYVVHVPFGGACIPLHGIGCGNDDASKFYPESQRSSCSSLVQFESVSDSGSMEDLVIIHDISPDYARKGIEKLKKFIKQHMDDTCKKLQVHLNKDDYQKIWICYERIFFSVIYLSLEQVYKLAYKDKLKGLRDSVPKLTPESLDMLGNNVVANLFCDKISENQAECSSNKVETHSRNGDDEVFEQTVPPHMQQQAEASGESRETSLNIKSLMKKKRLFSDPGKHIKSRKAHSTKELKKRNRETTVYTDDMIDEVFSGLDEFELNSSELREGTAKLQGNWQVDSSDSRGNDPVELKTIEVMRDPFEVPNGAMGEDEAKSTETGVLSHCVKMMVSVDVKEGEPVTPNRMSSESSNLNLDLAEMLIANSTSGQLANQIHPQQSPVKSKYANAMQKINADIYRHLQKNVHVFLPDTVTYTGSGSNRNTWSGVLKDVELGEEVKTASREWIVQPNDTDEEDIPRRPSTPIDLKEKSIQIQPEFKEKLQGIINLFEDMCRESNPIDKLKKGFLALHYLELKVKEFSLQFTGKAGFGASTDELTDLLVVLLCNMDNTLLWNLFITVHIALDMIPDFYETGPYGYSVMQLTLGLQFLQERIVMQRRLIQNEQARACHQNVQA